MLEIENNIMKEIDGQLTTRGLTNNPYALADMVNMRFFPHNLRDMLHPGLW